MSGWAFKTKDAIGIRYVFVAIADRKKAEQALKEKLDDVQIIGEAEASDRTLALLELKTGGIRPIVPGEPL